MSGAQDGPLQGKGGIPKADRPETRRSDQEHSIRIGGFEQTLERIPITLGFVSDDEPSVSDCPATSELKTPVEYALQYASWGWHVFPVHTPKRERVRTGDMTEKWTSTCSCAEADCDDNIGKHPRISTGKGHKNASTNPEEIRSWWAQWPDANIGIATGSISGIFAVDIDPRHGGFESLTVLESEIGPFPETRRAATGGGGHHYLFRYPEGGRSVPSRAKANDRSGIDIRGDGGYFVAPPSVHKSGKAYRWLNPDTPVAVEPPKLLDALLTPKPGSTTRTALAPGEMIPEGARNDTLFREGCAVRGPNTHPTAVAGAIRAMNAKLCTLPLPDAEVDRIIESVLNQDRAEGGFDAAVEEEYRREKARRAGRRRVDDEERTASWVPPAYTRSLAEELAISDPPPVYTVTSLQRQGHNVLLTAQYKAGKTTLALNYLRALVDGEHFLGSLPVRKITGRVAFLQYELDEAEFRQQLRASNIMNPDRACVLNLRGVWMPLRAEHIESWLTGYLREQEVEVLVMDPWARVMSGNGSENSNDDVTLMTETLDVIKREAGVTDLLVTSHTGRAEMEEGAERARGATRLDDWADARWVYTRGKGDDRASRYLMAEGRGVELPESKLEFDPATLRLSLVGGSRRENVGAGLVDEVVRVLNEQPNLKTSDVHAALEASGLSGGSNMPTRQTAIKTAVDRGLVHRVAGPRNAKLLRPGPDPALSTVWPGGGAGVD